MASESVTPRFGANYVPSAGWFYSWLDYDRDAVRRDFADLAGMGLDHVRVFPVWPWIQPNRAIIREQAIADLLDTIDAAAEHGLTVAVDLIQGHLSSFDFLPSWVLTWHKSSLFEDSTVRDGLTAYVDAVARAVATKPNVFAITLGNEVNNLWPDSTTTPGTSTAWAQDLLTTLKKAAPDVLALHSVFDDAWYKGDHPFHPVDAVDLGDLTTVHSWVFNGVSRVDGPLGPATLTHADYLIELARATAIDPSRPVWLQEIGVPGPDIPVDLQAEFTRRTVETVLTNQSLYGVTWWSSHDIDRRLLDFPDREYDLGLFTVDHQRKPAAQALADVIAEVQANGVQQLAAAATLTAPINLRTEPERRAEVAPGSEFHLHWVEARANGPVRIALP
ncbi:cellulase (glycosyl hydrolase family 5) [Kribbella sp. VKM Ac-2571]|uniref:glycoside hydrolase 5 family protein n=1 Tax=Kribbella sp. VKM Ac-2571 TaxID=2512222 RepID=UPI0010603F46|nr:cellulase family glycosylhydrolase [Kribbella sp. VKM Ac-2571]TDO63819.1 cellulase (glycosyl hydrolase family 5) [Kribbella sp. VKM Ac-2571]